MTYIDRELLNVFPVSIENCGIIRMQIRSERGKTKWLNVSPDKMRKIEKILAEEDE